jgi:hypothetical protein
MRHKRPKDKPSANDRFISIVPSSKTFGNTRLWQTSGASSRIPV